MGKLISVIGVEGRLAFSKPVNGAEIPLDKAVSLPDSTWLQQRLSVGDIQLSSDAKKTKPKQPPMPTEAK